VRAYWLDQTLFVFHAGIGLTKMNGDTLVPVKSSESLAGSRVMRMLPFQGGSGRYLLLADRGLFVWDGAGVQPFPVEADELQEAIPYDGAVLPDGAFAIGTLTRGFYIVDQSGKTRLHLDMDSGLASNTVAVVYVDRQDNIWLGVDGAVTVLEYKSALSRFPAAFGGGTMAIRRNRGILYLAANEGIYYLDPRDSFIKPLTGDFIRNHALSFFEINSELFAPSGSGLIRVDNKKGFLDLTYQARYGSIIRLHKSKLDSAIAFAGQQDGLMLLRYDAGKSPRFTFVEKVPGIHEYIDTIAELYPGVLWCGTLNAGALRVTYSRNFSDFKVERYGSDQGLPVGGTSIYPLPGRLVYATKEGICKFDETAGRFSRDTFFAGVTPGLNPDETAFAADQKGNIWVNLGKESAVFLRQPDSSWQLQKGKLARFADDPATAIYPEADGRVWFGTARDVICYSPAEDSENKMPITAIIRRIAIARDSVIYNGAANIAAIPRTFPHRYNSIRFDFAAPSYTAAHGNSFTSKLVGFDEEWSEWSGEFKRNYTNLPAGRYRFQVRARNVDGQESLPAEYAFSISVPWYSSWWAWLIYAVVGAGAIFGLMGIRTRALREKSAALEKIVEERTMQIKSAQETLVTQSKLAALGALTAGIAHEIKNPLNFVNNFAELTEDLAQELAEELDKDPLDKPGIMEIMQTLKNNAGKIREHGKRADSIVKSMLQHSRGTSGERQLTDINAMLAEDINLAYHGMRAQNSEFNIQIETDLDSAVAKINVVPQDISRVFLNILSNSCYETQRKKATADAAYAPRLTVRSRNLAEAVEIRIRDNGNGIPAAIRDKLFLPFFTTKPAGQGTGLGLSISYDIIVQQHGGQLAFETREGEFTEFIIRLPK